MEKYDIAFMKEAIQWASGCHPIKESIPKVGAVIAVDGEVLGRGRRGTGVEGDDHHAEFNAIEQAKAKPMLAKATLYTTLEPCTIDVRRNPLECCTELIHQYRIKKVFVGIQTPTRGLLEKVCGGFKKIPGLKSRSFPTTFLRKFSSKMQPSFALNGRSVQ